MKKNRIVSRRSFLKNATAAVSAAVAVPTIIPASALGKNGFIAPSNRIVMGAVGVGSMGGGDLGGFLGNPNVQMIAVCDVDKPNREGAQKRVNDHYKNEDCKSYLDFRELIGRGDLDAIMHALPDHWHATVAVAAARAGLDIHGQKPLARTIKDSIAIRNAVHEHGVVWQTGSQQRSEERFRFACELVRNGRLGKILRTEVGLPTGSANGPSTDPIPVPEGLDWNMWLGPAPWRECQAFSGRGPHWNWRWVMDFSGGQLTDWAGHHIDIAQWGLGLEKTGPVEVEGKGLYPTGSCWDVPYNYDFNCTYANGQLINVTHNQKNAQGVKWIGDKGWVYVRRGFIDAEPKSLLKEKIGSDEIQLYRSEGHKENFINCIRSRKETVAPVEIGHRSICTALLGEIAMLTGRKIRWNPETEEIIGDPGASALLGRAYREPWGIL